MRRLSIGSVMVLIVVCAVGLSALRDANNLWAGMLFLLALGAVGMAVLGAVFLRGSERAWWAGFAFFAGEYLALAAGPWLSDGFQQQLGTSHLLGRIRSRMHPAAVQMERELPYLQIERQGTLASWISLQRSDGKSHPGTLREKRELEALDQEIAGIKSAPTQAHFQRVGQLLMELYTDAVA